VQNQIAVVGVKIPPLIFVPYLLNLPILHNPHTQTSDGEFQNSYQKEQNYKAQEIKKIIQKKKKKDFTQITTKKEVKEMRGEDRRNNNRLI
jgi:hypothetical protein